MNGRSDDLALYLTPPHPCSYFDDRQARTLFADPAAQMDTALYTRLAQRGFRRSGEHVYRPRCDTCNECIACRVAVKQFVPKRRQRRCRAANRDLEMRVLAAEFDAEHYALYRRYTAARHPDGGMAEAGPEEYRRFLWSTWSDTMLLEFRLAGVLVCVAATDRLQQGLSAVYTFFEPGLDRRSLGTYAILSQIGLAANLGLSHLYLGYWIPGCRKMRYKRDFEPLECHLDGAWRQPPVAP